MSGMAGGKNNLSRSGKVRRDVFSRFNPPGFTGHFLRHIFVTCELRRALRVINFRQFQ